MDDPKGILEQGGGHVGVRDRRRRPPQTSLNIDKFITFNKINPWRKRIIFFKLSILKVRQNCEPNGGKSLLRFGAGKGKCGKRARSFGKIKVYFAN